MQWQHVVVFSGTPSKTAVRKTSGGARGGARTHVRDTCRIRADLADGYPPAPPLLSFNSAAEHTHVSAPPPGTLDGADAAEKRHEKIIYEPTRSDVTARHRGDCRPGIRDRTIRAERAVRSFFFPEKIAAKHVLRAIGRAHTAPSWGLEFAHVPWGPHTPREHYVP